MESTPIYAIPVFRLQRGNSALIMNPVVGDIGHLLICDRDTRRVRATRQSALPSTRRRHNRADGIYMGGLLNMPPTQFIEFADNRINITSPGNIEIHCQQALSRPFWGDPRYAQAHFTGNVTAAGDITDNVGTQQASIKALREAYNSHYHHVNGVESGSSRVTSDKPEHTL
ncbi:phage baseplate protein [Candidatus Arsenophonus triatominarum]|uniref:phage baseplate protein n=1 Tax=Candidatus Arsenophonus triatominarum TaxID=57911 RepID=UPI001396B914|nr:phage baseplate protein [Candidatus Arsenophonus triatominarum]